MKKPQIKSDSLECFIKLFLPEGTIIDSKKFELTSVLKLVNVILDSINLQTTIEAIFSTFFNLKYPISVVEPFQKDKESQPYKETNSHAIYIGIDSNKLNKMNTFSKYLLTKGSTIPDELKDMFDQLHHF